MFGGNDTRHFDTASIEAVMNIARCWSRWAARTIPRLLATEIARDSVAVYSTMRSTGEIEEGLAAVTNIGGCWS